MKSRYLIALLTLGAAAFPAWAERQPGWDFGAELLYQDPKDIDFNGGSSASLEDDIGLALVFAYRFNERFELTFGLDWNTVDYDFNVIADVPSLSFSGTGDLESFTPRVGLNINILKGDLTPYVTGGVGWAFIDTNVPTSLPQTACWWDPWWGYYCGTYQETRSIDELMYNIGVGVRWDVSSTISLRFGYEKHWLDIGEATSTPDLDQLKFGVMARY